MKKLLFIFLISSLSYAQQSVQAFPASYQISKKTLVKSFTYKDLIDFFNAKMEVSGESLKQSIARCKFIVKNAEAKQDYGTLQSFSMILQGLEQAEKSTDLNNAWFNVYDKEGSYNFYTADDKFIGRVFRDKLDEDFQLHSNRNEVFLLNYIYISQE